MAMMLRIPKSGQCTLEMLLHRTGSCFLQSKLHSKTSPEILGMLLRRAGSCPPKTQAQTKKCPQIPNKNAPSKGPKKGGYKLYKNIFFFVCIPIIVLLTANAFIGNAAAQEEWNQNRPEFIPYEYLARRTKPFPWGDGNHSLFHNRHRNALPDGYEEEEEDEEEDDDEEDEEDENGGSGKARRSAVAEGVETENGEDGENGK